VVLRVHLTAAAAALAVLQLDGFLRQLFPALLQLLGEHNPAALLLLALLQVQRAVLRVRQEQLVVLAALVPVVLLILAVGMVAQQWPLL
jgi:hypothetical protein